MDTAVVWFRRDLRIADNLALADAVKRADSIVPVYVLSEWKKKHRWTGAHRQQFLRGCLESLSRNLHAIGGGLVTRQGTAVDELATLIRETGAQALFFNRNSDPFGRKNEAELASLGRKMRIEIVGYKDSALHDPDEVLAPSGEPFCLFSPFASAWAQLGKTGASGPVQSVKTVQRIFSLGLSTLQTWQLRAEGEVLQPGEKAARARMKTFLESGLARYETGRKSLAKPTTSRLSQDLRFGLVSIRELFQKCQARAADLPPAGRKSAQKFITELIWREFYLNILGHFPEVLQVEFNSKFRELL
jgi:deoxyribodipyrimidine photo-lyase